MGRQIQIVAVACRRAACFCDIPRRGGRHGRLFRVFADGGSLYRHLVRQQVLSGSVSSAKCPFMCLPNGGVGRVVVVGW